jgi:hypothetical protein
MGRGLLAGLPCCTVLLAGCAGGLTGASAQASGGGCQATALAASFAVHAAADGIPRMTELQARAADAAPQGTYPMDCCRRVAHFAI